jgi:hypothetical protein
VVPHCQGHTPLACDRSVSTGCELKVNLSSRTVDDQKKCNRGFGSKSILFVGRNSGGGINGLRRDMECQLQTIKCLTLNSDQH